MATLMNGNTISLILYGTARRKHKPTPNLLAAMQVGYRAIDSASSRSFHDEGQDGKAMSEFIAKHGIISRQDLFVQSKYAPPAEHVDHLPFDLADNNTVRVFKSVLRSAAELKVDVIDVYFLHTQHNSLEAALEVWHALERIVDHGGIRYLGMANVRISRLRKVYESVQEKPKFVQNWFRSTNKYDREVVVFCRERSIVYQIFGVFDAANAFLLESEPVRLRANKQLITSHQALLQMLLGGAAATGLYLCILDGTTNQDHIRENLSAVTQLGTLKKSEVEPFLKLIGWA